MNSNKYIAFDKTGHIVFEGFLDSIDSYKDFKDCVFINITNPNDKLATMLYMQEKFQTRLKAMPVPKEKQTQYIMNQALYADAEIHEMLRELEGFKAWKTYDWSEAEQKEHLANAKEEFIDAVHFILNIALALGMTADELFSIYVNKNLTNHTRQDNGY